jgi:hypothetical protein
MHYDGTDCKQAADISEIKSDVKTMLVRLAVLETINSLQGKKNGIIYGGVTSLIIFLVGNFILHSLKT